MHDFLIEFAGFTVVFTAGFWFGWRTYRKGIEYLARVRRVGVSLYDQDEER